MQPLRPLARSIATVCLSGVLPDKLDAAARAGFEAVELFENDLLAHDGTPAEIRRMADDLGLRIALYQPFRDFEAMPEPQRSRNLDRAERKFDIMQALGCEQILVCSNVQEVASGDPDRAAADLRAMAERAAARGLRVGYEALAWGRHINLWRQAWDIVRRADHPALGLIVDSFHTLCVGDDPSGLAELPGEKIFFVQLADGPKLTMDVLSWSRHFRNFPGQGELDVAGFLRAVLASGYAGPLSLEVFNDGFRAAPPTHTARDGLRSLVLVEAEARPRAPASALPPAQEPRGIEFLEFAVDAETAGGVEDYIASFGFRRTGRHRSKAVELWSRGKARLVVNAEPDGAAAGHFALHGPSVCAMALRVPDVDAVVRRANALRLSTWRERHGEDEENLQGVRTPDGSLVLLVDDSDWEQDFLPVGDGSDTPEPFTGIDHVALSLPAWQVDAAVLFWRGLFGLRALPPVDLPDPRGLVRSRALVTPRGGLRLPLNASDWQGTATGRFLNASSGGGVHHIAFAATDAAKSTTGLPLLDLPANYYDDLEARFGLDDAMLGQLQRGRLLYDRDAAQGEFLHAYGPLYAHRFFFEVVERRQGYAGFGEANAAVRLAAQARHELHALPGEEPALHRPKAG